MKRKKLLEWEDNNKAKIAKGDKLFFAYEKRKGHYSLAVLDNGMAIGVRCKTERDCLIVSNILNKV
jgi:hypothetical protein